MEKTYLKDLERLKELADQIPNSKTMAIAKISAMIPLNMRYESIMVNRNLDKHPYELVASLIKDASIMLTAWKEVSFIEDPSGTSLDQETTLLEEKHQDLFQQLWTNFSLEEYKERIDRYLYRLDVNGLGNGWLKGFKCIDFGCGHGNFAHALIRKGAEYVYGIDFGENSIAFAKNARDKLGIDSNKIEFRNESVYKVSTDSDTFDFAIQNGVFHHLEDEEAAYNEVWRVLKPGGWFWVYTDGSGAISHDLWDASVYILRDIPQEFVISYLDYLNIKTGKRYHLGDGLNAVYRHESWNGLTSRLSKIGFENFKRLVGGFPTDFDHDVISKDKYGAEKFGEGDLRLLAQKITAA